MLNNIPIGSTVVQWVSASGRVEIAVPLDAEDDFDGFGGTLCYGKLRFDTDFIALEKPRENPKKQIAAVPAAPAWYAPAQSNNVPSWYK